jgi:hypothetical protein
MVFFEPYKVSEEKKEEIKRSGEFREQYLLIKPYTVKT